MTAEVPLRVMDLRRIEKDSRFLLDVVNRRRTVEIKEKTVEFPLNVFA
jgi:hypothetical protein